MKRTKSIATITFTFAIAVIVSSCQDTTMEEIERDINNNPNREINGGNNSDNENSDNNDRQNGNENGDQNNNGSEGNNNGTEDGNTNEDENKDKEEGNGKDDNSDDNKNGGDNSPSYSCRERVDSNELPLHTRTYITSNYTTKAPYYYISKVTICKENGIIKSYTVTLDGPYNFMLNFDKYGNPMN